MVKFVKDQINGLSFITELLLSSPLLSELAPPSPYFYSVIQKFILMGYIVQISK